MRSRSKARDTNPELDITSFMNLMVILIPFLLQIQKNTCPLFLRLNSLLN